MKEKIAIILFFLYSFCFAQKTIKGEIILFNPKDKAVVAEKKLIYLRDDIYSTLATDSVYIDKNLHFEFNNVSKDSINLFFKPRNYPWNMSYNVNLNGDNKKWEKLKLDYSPDCPYSKTDSICPKCHNSKNTVPIVYGLVMLKKDTDKVKLGGCVTTGCDPNWYCKKHKLRF